MSVLLFLPTDDADFTWMRIDESGAATQGVGLPSGNQTIVAIAPAAAVTLHWADLPTRSPAQMLAAARILAAEASATPAAELHVAIGSEEGAGGVGDRPIGVVAVAAMRQWLAMLAVAGVDPDAIVPAPMLLPRPEAGYVRAEIGGHSLVRGHTSGFADEARLTELVTMGSTPVTLDRTALDEAIAIAAATPALDLRQGAFALRRGRVAIDWPMARRIGLLAVAILAVTLAIGVVRIARYAFAADALEARADTLAATGLQRGETITDPDRQLTERTTRMFGPGIGFTTTTAAAFAAIRNVPGTEVTGIDFNDVGSLRLSVSTEREALATDLKRALERAGFGVRASVFQTAAGRVTGELTVVPQ